MIKEAEIDALATPWANARVSSLLSVCRMITVDVGGDTAKKSSPDSYDQVMFTQNVETIEAFPSHMVPVKAGMAYTGEHLNIIVQALWTEDRSLPHGLTVQNTYRAEARKEKGSCGGQEQYGSSADPPEEDPSGQGSCNAPSAQNTHGGSVQEGMMGPRILIPPN